MSSPVEPTSVTFDELEQQATQAAAAGPDLTQIKLEGENVPELIRGKTVAEAIQQFGTLENALKVSEQARVGSQQQQQAAPAAPVVEEPKDLTDEELSTLYEEDPIKAIKAMNEQATRRVQKNLESRMGSLAEGTAAQVEAAARAKYGDEFELFGAEISQLAAQIPNARQYLTNPAAWDDLVALVRGRAGNFDRLLQHKMQRTTTVRRDEARSEQRESVGFSDSSATRGRIPDNIASLDATQKEIAANLGMTPAEYIKWSKI